LANQLGGVEPGILLLLPSLKPVSAYAVVFRYPGHSATKQQATAALSLAKDVREIVRAALQIPRAKSPAKRPRAAAKAPPRKKPKRR